MTTIGDKLQEAIKNKSNNIKEFVWKFARNSNNTQDEIKLIDATPEQLNSFYKHCHSMLYNNDKLNPGRYVLLDIIAEQRRKCNVELFLRKLESGALCSDGKPYPRHLYIQDIKGYINRNKTEFPTDELKNIPISSCTNGLPREFERISIDDVINGCLYNLGWFDNKHITFSFIINLGLYLTPSEMQEFTEKDESGKIKNRLELIKKKLNLPSTVFLKVKPTGLSFKELRAMVNLRSMKYSDLTTDQLTILRNKVLFEFESEVQKHIDGWEERIRQIKLVAKEKNISLSEN